MPFATVNGLKINYVTRGTGPHLLMFAPGGFRSVISRWTSEGMKGVWQEMNALDALAKHFTVIAYDRRESGLSEGRIEPLDWNVYAHEAKGLLDHLGVKQSYILGGCMGASLALRMGVLFPERCKGLLMHWPVGGYRWLMRGKSDFQRHIDFVRANGFAAVVERAPKLGNFFLDPEIGPWGSPAAVYPAFAEVLKQQKIEPYLEIVAATRDAFFKSEFPSGATGDEMLKMTVPSIVMSGADASHPISAAWAIKELVPNVELWNVFPPNQNAGNLFDAITGFINNLEGATAKA